MEGYASEQEQVESIKKWFKENGKAIVAGLILGVIVLVGWQQWRAYIKNQRETASMEYEQVMLALSRHDYAAVVERGSRLLIEYDNTPYAGLAALAVAKAKLEQGDGAAAKSFLQRVIDGADEMLLQQIARLRLARLLLAEGKANEAKTLLEKADLKGFEAVAEELKGDVYMALNARDAAKAAYTKALNALEPGMDNTVLSMKLDELGGVEDAK